MLTKENTHFIIRNEQGLECQRFILVDSDFSFLDEYHDDKYENSFYHTAQYSFDDADLVFFLAYLNYFFVFPKKKDDSFLGSILNGQLYVQSSAHIMKNSSLVWLLGGLKIKNELFDLEQYVSL